MTGSITRTELLSQPDHWATLLSRLRSGALSLPAALIGANDYLLVGSGTSYYLALAVADWIRRRGHSARAVPSCEVLLDPYETRTPRGNSVAIGFSRSGYSTELVRAMRHLSDAGMTTLGISCTAESDLVKEADHSLLITEGQEDGLIMLRSFTSMLIAAQWMFGNAEDHAQLATLPDAGQAFLGQEPSIHALATRRAFDRFVFLASGSAYPLAVESSLKIQEMAVATSEAYHSLDYRHGPKACADGNTVVFLFALSDREHGLALARDVKALGATLMVLGTDADAYRNIADLALAPNGPSDDSAASAALMLPVQLFALATALRRGKNPDAPVNLSRVVVF